MPDNYLTVSHLSTKDLTRIFSKIRISKTTFYKGIPCWEWTGGRSARGYGYFRFNDKQSYAHRILYAWCVEPLPRGCQDAHLDHLCVNTSCVNPSHLELVTPRENAARSRSVSAINMQKTHCPRGHGLVYLQDASRKHARRGCRTCRQIRQKERRAIPEIRTQIRATAKERTRKKRATDPAFTKAMNKKSRDRYAIDPEYAERLKARARELFKRKRQDPEWTEKERIRKQKYAKTRKLPPSTGETF